MAKQYKITSKTVNNDSVTINVQYMFSSPDVPSTQTVNVSIGFYQPQSLQDITDGVNNRGTSELQKILSTSTVSGFYDSIVVGTDFIDLS
jgi:hypothetical protein